MKQTDLNILNNKNLSPSQKEVIERELEFQGEHYIIDHSDNDEEEFFNGLYDNPPFETLQDLKIPDNRPISNLQTIDDLMERDNQREEDGFPRKIRLGRLMKPDKDDKKKIIVVPTTTEPKFYHDDSTTDEEDETGGSGEGEEGEVIGEQPAQPQEGQGEGEGAGQGEGADHDIAQEAFDLGKVLTEKFKLPNIKEKGKKQSITKYKYDLTDRNRGFGQILDKKATLNRVIRTNILLGRISGKETINTEDMLINPKDEIYRILSKEKDYESQAIVFFLRDYSGSMQGKPTEVIATQHLFIYSWLMYQYQNMVESRFILHDNEAKEVPDFYTYHNSAVAGGTSVFPAFEMVNKIVEEENLARDYNIYVFYGTDGDDWEEDGKKMLEATNKMLGYVNRVGITIAKNSWSRGGETTVEKYMNRSGLLKEKPDLIKLDAFQATEGNEDRIIKSIKLLVAETK
jgi:uncharacterized sporulation protein YeaH/YhbH (DUF444 family)